jgi:hypothetical protein
MKSLALELAAVAAAAAPRPRQTRAEAETSAFLAEMDIIAEQMNSMTRDERMERSHAVLKLCVSPANAEAVRAAYWTNAPEAARMVAVMAARIPNAQKRAKGTLNTFNALERGLIWNAIGRLTQQLAVVQKCMNGGAMPGAQASDTSNQSAGLADSALNWTSH